MALDFLAGCLGGCAGVIVGHPFDTVKVKLQTQDYKNPVYRGTWDCFSKILRTESVAGVYRGVSSPMAGVAVVNAIVFGVHGNMQRSMADPDTLQSHFLAGAAAGLIQSVVASPVELVKTRVQTSSQYRSPMDCFKKTLKHEGIHGVFKGLSITGVREFLGYGLYFATYEALTRTAAGGAPVTTACMLLAGGLSGTVSWVFTYPLDVIKTRFQADAGQYSSMVDCIKKSVRSEGMMFLTKGLTPTIIRAFPTNAVTFTVVTWVFRLADHCSINFEAIKEGFQSVLQLPKESYMLKNLELVDTKVPNVELSSPLFKGKLQNLFLTTEDFWIYDECDEQNDSNLPANVMNLKETKILLDKEKISVNQNEMPAFSSNTNNIEWDTTDSKTNDEYKNVLR